MPLPTVPFLISCGVRPDTALIVSPGLSDICTKLAIIGREQVSGFLAQCMHESHMFTKLEEDMSYSAARLMVVWPHRFPNHVIADEYAHNPQKLANFVYSGRNGNGPVESNDGYNFRGTGYLQTTGRNNFLVARIATGTDYISSPELGRTIPAHGAAMAGCFWHSNGFNTLIVTAGIDAVTHKINPYDDAQASDNRRHLYARAYAASQSA